MSTPPNNVADRATDSTIGEMEKLVEAWVSSKEGTEQLLATVDSARVAAASVTSDAKIKPEQLRQAVTL